MTNHREIDSFPIDVDHFRTKDLNSQTLDLIEKYRETVLAPIWDAFLERYKKLAFGEISELERTPFPEFVKSLQEQKSHNEQNEKLEQQLKDNGFDLQQLWYYAGLTLLNPNQHGSLPKDFFRIFDYDNQDEGSKLVGWRYDNDQTKLTRWRWRYDNCLGKPYPDKEKEIDSVTFNVSRYGRFQHTIRFNTRVTVKTAIESVEDYLSQPLTKDYYQLIKYDLFHNHDWAEAMKWFKTRGNCLTDAKFLEYYKIDRHGNLTVFCGS